MTKSKILFVSFLICISMSFLSCKDDSEEIFNNQKIADEQLIQDYLTSNKLTSQKTASGLHRIIIQEGTGDTKPNLNSKVEVKYRGSLLDGRVFDQTDVDKTITFGLSQVITGWQEGLQLMQKGEKSMLIIPSYLGYGTKQLSGIPANSVLIFDIELVNF